MANYTPPRRGRTPVLQGKTVGGSDRYVDRYTCSQCAIAYNVIKGQHAVCPLCEAEKHKRSLQDTIYKLTNQLNQALNDLDAAKSLVDVSVAMRAAVDAMSQEDLAWLKSIVYHWQADRGKVALKATHGVPKSKKKSAPPDGFIAMFRDGSEVDVRQCNSVGGLALAGYLEEATALVGQIKAMELVARAVMRRLTGDAGG